ncbi:hypothetical protein DM01DRAFT_1405177 [Hesseltinella vesiculosa]|uniref:Arrestin C-terminal-like domain-containing protein n=1 Tax=Hesseltinella vesiculosa TaxID=101127 RepID=A0A1X2GRP4_9FUNG|nr:hypothetical protein DM01DRAFT_1405177 [Hesseltinella vesiculosa]
MDQLNLVLLPEFGWTIQNKPVFGPGSVFQGHVDLNLCKRLLLDRVRLVFQARERLHYCQTANGVDENKAGLLFAVQQTLWESKQGNRQLDPGHHELAFTIQMPMVQFPPTVDQDFYKCTFKLIAVAERALPAGGFRTLLLHEEPLMYMPFVETSLNKLPFQIQQKQDDMVVTVAMPTLDVLLGEELRGQLQVCHTTTNKPKPLEYVLRLQQCMTPLDEDLDPHTRDVASLVGKLLPGRNTQPDDDSKKNKTVLVASYETDFQLAVPEHLPPTFTYGRLAAITYRLVMTIKRNGPLGMWAYEWTKEVPVTLGTLGLGLHVPIDLHIYTTLPKETAQQQRPRFMKAIEYEDALPLYEPIKLPDYTLNNLLVLPDT